MIRIEKADRWRHCNCCYSQNDVHELYFAAQNHEINVALCDSCIVKLLETIREEKKGKGWIPVSERLPEHGKVVLVYGKRGAIYTAWCNSLYKNPGWHKLNSKSHYCDPTHWMPLPEPPKEA